ncbi:MAG: hypothetical protein KDJ90_09315 [Nitratireductor sp.]|nr:hypothetical protein [Nitratireductor sp.]
MAFLLEVVADRAGHSNELLLTSLSSETQHHPLAPSKRHAAVLRPMIGTAARVLPIFGTRFLQHGSTRARLVSNDDLRSAASSHRCSRHFSVAFLPQVFVAKLSGTSLRDPPHFNGNAARD